MSRFTNIPINARVSMRSGKIGRYLGLCTMTGKHRVQTSNKYAEFSAGRADDSYTVWLLNEAGKARGDLKECPEDCLGLSPEGGA